MRPLFSFVALTVSAVSVTMVANSPAAIKDAETARVIRATPPIIGSDASAALNPGAVIDTGQITGVGPSHGDPVPHSATVFKSSRHAILPTVLDCCIDVDRVLVNDRDTAMRATVVRRDESSTTCPDRVKRKGFVQLYEHKPDGSTAALGTTVDSDSSVIIAFNRKALTEVKTVRIEYIALYHEGAEQEHKYYLEVPGYTRMDPKQDVGWDYASVDIQESKCPDTSVDVATGADRIEITIQEMKSGRRWRWSAHVREYGLLAGTSDALSVVWDHDEKNATPTLGFAAALGVESGFRYVGRSPEFEWFAPGIGVNVSYIGGIQLKGLSGGESPSSQQASSESTGSPARLGIALYVECCNGLMRMYYGRILNAPDESTNRYYGIGVQLLPKLRRIFGLDDHGHPEKGKRVN